MKLLLISISLLFSQSIFACQCVYYVTDKDNRAYAEDEIVYEVQSYGSEFLAPTNKEIELLQNQVDLILGKIKALKSSDESEESLMYQISLLEELKPLQDNLYGLKFGKKSFTLPVIKTIKGPKKTVLNVSQTWMMCGTFIEEGNDYLLVINKNHPENIPPCSTSKLSNAAPNKSLNQDATKVAPIS